MKHSAASDRLARAKIAHTTYTFRLDNFIRSNSFFAHSIRAQAGKHLFFSLPFLSRVHNYCSLTGRSRGVLREFKLSRLSFKRLVGLRYIVGVKRSSW